MLHRVIGRAGSGKTTYLLAVLREALQDGADCIVLVPEQQSLVALCAKGNRELQAKQKEIIGEL